MNNKIIIEFGFRIIWSIMEISEVLSAFGGLQGFQMTDAQPKETKDLGDQWSMYRNDKNLIPKVTTLP